MHVSVVHGSIQADLTLDLAGNATVGDVLGALGLEPPATLTVDGRSIELEDAAAKVLYHGAELRLDEATPAGSEPVFELHAIEGPPAGQVWRLAVGRYDIGAAPAAIRWRHAPAGRSELVVGLTAVTIDGCELPEGHDLRVGNARFRLRPAEPPGPAAAGAVTFNRPPRVLDQPPAVALTPPTRTPERSRTRRLSPISLVLPAGFGVGMAIIFGRVMFLAFALMGPLMMVGNVVDDRIRRWRDRRRHDEQFAEDLIRFERTLEELVVREAQRRRLSAASAAELVSAVDRGSPRIWERRPGHPDFMRVPIGTGTLAWRAGIAEDGLEAEVQAILDRAGRLANVPLQVDLRPGTVIGIYGVSRHQALGLVRSWICAAAAQQGPADLRLAVLTDHPAAWDWAKWLPHVRANDGEVRLLAADSDQAASILGFLRGPYDGDVPLTLLISDMESEEPELRTVQREVLAGAGLPVATVVIRSRRTDLPGACTQLVELDGELLRVSDPGQGGDPTIVQPWTATTGAARHLARRLARLDDPETVSPSASLPETAPLVPMIGLGTLSPDAITRRWSTAERMELAAAIGRGQGGDLRVDLVRDGPHGLIAGTTGSGKSELLRALVAGLAAGYDPQRLNFVLIDYKGGSAFDACSRLPHVVGLVTDLDEQLGARALTCLEAELRYREQRLRAAGASDITDYAAQDGAPLPRMVLIVDEFAALAAELPDFMNALVDIAQRGRSLGVHMILATQRPSGVVKDSIRANTNLRISLRVQTAADSKDVLDDPAAARIPRTRPGRGYLRLGPGELVAFQSAIATLPHCGDAGAGIRLSPFKFSMHDPPPPPPTATGPSELDLLVGAIVTANIQAGFDPPRRPWPDPLPARLVPADLATPGEAVPDGLVLGLADEPELQRRRLFTWDPPVDGNLLLVGPAGPSDAMRAIAAGIALHHPDDSHIYAIDYKVGGLTCVAGLPHAGAVIAGRENERQQRLLRMLDSEIAHRRASRAARTRIFLLLDDLSGFRGSFDEMVDLEYREALQRIVADGPSVAVYTVMSADQARSIPGVMLGVFRARLVFQLADRMDYGALGVMARDLPELGPNRAIDVVSGRFVQVVAYADEEILPAGPVGTLPRSAPSVDTLPPTVKLADLMHAGARAGTAWALPIGISDHDLGPALLQLEAGDHALVTGSPRSGKSTVLATLAAAARHLAPACRIVGICPRQSPLRDEPGVDHLLDNAQDLGEILGLYPGADMMVLVDDADEVDDVDDAIAGVLAARRPGLHVIAAARSHALRSTVRHWTKALRAGRRGLILQPQEAVDGEPLGARLPRALPPALPVGRGFLCDPSGVALVQTPLP